MALPSPTRTRLDVPDEFITVASVAEIPPGSAKAVMVGPYEVAVFHVGDEWYAIENTCPHQGGPLSEGWVSDVTVTCPWHAWCFSLVTGRMTLMELEGVAAFEVRAADGCVWVSLQPKEHVA